MGKKGRVKNGGIQTDIYGNQVHILNTAGIYRTVKCGECGEVVKSSQAKLHMSFGKRLNICHGCMEKIEKGKNVHRGIIIGPSKMLNTIERYAVDGFSI
jgi:NAD-dependent SIR2 family protein deacetylase